MKKSLAISLLLNMVLALGLGLTWKALTAHAAGGHGGGVPVENGDVNGDGTIDISDAVYILGFLFTGTNGSPVAIECPPDLSAKVQDLEAQLAACKAQQGGGKGLPATGQTKCYGIVEGQGWTEVPCDQATCQGQDGQHAAGCPSEGRFVDNGDGTVTDHCTGLMWQKDTADVNGDGQVRNDGSDVVSWCDALAYCEKLSFAGHDDWRLPNVRELQSIVDYGRFGPSIDPVFGAFSILYWSSTSVADGPDPAWGVGFFDGFVDNFGKGNLSFVRAVRSGP